MILNEAIAHAREVASRKYAEGLDGCTECAEEHKQLAEWLEELKQYQTIGTVEECQIAVEKQQPQIADLSGDGYADGHLVYDTYECPNCGEHYELDYNEYEYCPNCGQHMKIEWEDAE